MAFINYIPTEKRLQIGAETVVRALPFGTGWRKLRIGFRCSLADTLGDCVGTTLLVGVMQGAYGWPDLTVPDAVAPIIGGTNLDAASTWSRIRDGSGNMCYRVGNTATVWKQLNTVKISGTNGSGSGFIPLTHTGLLGGVLATIENLGATFYTNSYASTAGNISRATFLAAMENDASPAGFTTQANTTIAYTGSAQYTHAFVFWNQSTPTMDIADFTVCRYY